MFGGGPGGGAVPPWGMMFGPGAAQDPHNPLQAMFGQGGQVDPAMLQQIFAQQAFQMPFQQQQQPEQRHGPPPTSAATLRSLPKIKVTAYDIAANEGSECSICLGDLVQGEPALRIPCGHLFHEDCVKDWLKKSNECPVCRFELPTDDAEYEKGRLTRMAGRKIRLRRADLDVKSISELQRLASFIGVNVRGCLEKSEIVESIATSPKVQIVQDDAIADPIAAAGAPTFTSSQLEAMSIVEVRATAQRLRVDVADCAEDKEEMLSRLQQSGRILVSADLSAGGANDQSASAVPTAHVMDAATLSGKSVGELRRMAKENNISLDGCLEKAEIVQRLQRIQHL